MTALRRFISREADLWLVSTVILVLLILAPLLTVLGGVVQAGPKWDHIVSTTLGMYALNTVILLITVPLLSLLFAVPSAWLTASCDFPGRRLFEWGLVMPLAIPTYVAAFVYFQIPEVAIPLLVQIRQEYGVDAFRWAERIMRYGVLSMTMAAVLFPYLYIGLRASFSQQQQNAIEVARTLGRRPFSVFSSVALPMARPAVVAGLSLICMEIINDYGAVHFFGVPTLTEGIFRTWFGLGDKDSALRMASLIMVGVILILALEQWQRGRARFTAGSERGAPLTRRKLTGFSAFGAILVCLIPLFIGLLYPLWRLSTWAWISLPEMSTSALPASLGRSVALALVTAFVLTGIAILLVWTSRLHPRKWLTWMTRAGASGYAAPGAVVAIGMMTVLAFVDGRLESWQANTSFYLSGTLLAIGGAYMVRFLAVTFYPVQAGMSRIGGHLDEASRMLDRSKGYTLWKIHLPLLRSTALAAMMLVFVDILKELPLTMILRPANFETLATTAFSLASEGRLYECSVPSLVIIAAGAAGLIVLNHFMKNRIS